MTKYNVWRKNQGDTWWIAVAEDLVRTEADRLAGEILASAKRLDWTADVQVQPVGREPE